MSISKQLFTGLVGASILLSPIPIALASKTQAKAVVQKQHHVHGTGPLHNRYVIEAVQLALNDRGSQLSVNGVLNKQTRRDLKHFQQQVGVPATGRLNHATLNKLGLYGLDKALAKSEGTRAAKAH